jgi:hypothetical protein
MIRTGQWKTAKHHKRVAYLKAHPLLAQIPSTQQDVDEAQSLLLADLAREMRQHGLFSTHTSLREVKWSIRLCAGEARS